jgi:hypothetical protein
LHKAKQKSSYEDRENEREKSEEILERAKFELKRVRDIETGKVLREPIGML